MKKLTKQFNFEFPLNNKIVRDLKIVTELVTVLKVAGVATYDPQAVGSSLCIDIDFIFYKPVNGYLDTDIKPVLELTPMIDDIQEAAEKFVTGLLQAQQEAATPAPMFDVKERILDVVQNDPLYFIAPLEINAVCRLYAVCVSPSNGLYAMDQDQQWHQISKNDKPVFDAVTKKVKDQLKIKQHIG